METKKKISGLSMSHRKRWASLATFTMGIIASFISAILISHDLKITSREWINTIFVAVTMVVLSEFITALLARRERRSSLFPKLKDNVSNAYLSALEDNPLNPIRRGER